MYGSTLEEACSDLVSWDESEFAAVPQEDVSCSALRVDSCSIISDDGRGVSRHAKLFGSKANHSREWSLLRNLCAGRVRGHKGAR